MQAFSPSTPCTITSLNPSSVKRNYLITQRFRTWTTGSLKRVFVGGSLLRTWVSRLPSTLPGSRGKERSLKLMRRKRRKKIAIRNQVRHPSRSNVRSFCSSRKNTWTFPGVRSKQRVRFILLKYSQSWYDIVSALQIKPSELLILHDDLEKPLSKLRFRWAGSAKYFLLDVS